MVQRYLFCGGSGIGAVSRQALVTDRHIFIRMYIH